MVLREAGGTPERGMSFDAPNHRGIVQAMTPSTRLYFIVARKAPLAVVFRRGPSKEVELLTWNLETDELTGGQWLKGRIYERRADLSPSGRQLVYFAAKYRAPLKTWTAVSRPPYLTALALWPKGDGWGGGGLFDGEGRLSLNHRPDEMRLMDGFATNHRLKVSALGDASGWGEDDPIHHMRLLRDGWMLADVRTKSTMHELGAPHFHTFDPPIRYERTVGGEAAALTLEMSIQALHERDGAWYVLSYRLLRDSEVIRDLGRADWADADVDGNVILAQDGRLFRLALNLEDEVVSAALALVADLRAHRFENRPAPAWATRW